MPGTVDCQLFHIVHGTRCHTCVAGTVWLHSRQCPTIFAKLQKHVYVARGGSKHLMLVGHLLTNHG